MTRLMRLFADLFVLASLNLLAAVSLAGDFPNENVTYSPGIKTVQFYKQGFELSAPVFQLNSTGKLALDFDDLDSGSKAYKYTIRHCEADWKTSADLRPTEYINGYTEENINDFQYSLNTTVRFVHYSMTFPSGTMSPKISGNYLLIVYLDDPSDPVFTRRFMVVEVSPLAIEGTVQQGSKTEDHLTKQQIDFVVRLNGFRVMDIRRELKVVVQQDDRWDNALFDRYPRFVRGEELDYRYDENNVFNGGSPYRNFDIKSLTYQTERIDKIFYDTLTQVFLLQDQPRTYKNYVYNKDINGRYLIKNEVNATNFNIESDYALVHFFLQFPVQITDGDFYLMGALTNWRMDENSRLLFNSSARRYEIILLMKQGYYNYSYVLLKKGKTMGDESLVEGSHWETPHMYTVYVYYRPGAAEADLLIAVQDINSIQQN
ncbi:MAG: DUF5103 domain-containing protein [Bacteroidetes bacterium]|nr:MAG: DUF5103 domain-containing protein [Bacteroidota bacterium]